MDSSPPAVLGSGNCNHASGPSRPRRSRTLVWRLILIASLLGCVFLPFPSGTGACVLLFFIVVMRQRPVLLGLSLGMAILLGVIGTLLLSLTQSPINRKNFDAIQVGWSKQQVEVLLGAAPGNYARPGAKVLRQSATLGFLRPAEESLAAMNPDWTPWLSDDGLVAIKFDHHGNVEEKGFRPVMSPDPLSIIRRLLEPP